MTGVQTCALPISFATSADSATPTLIYDAKLEIHSPRGVRFVPINGFHTGPGKVSLEHDEILVAFHFPPQPKEHAGSAHFKYAMRDAMDISTIGCAAHCRLDNGNFSESRRYYGQLNSDQNRHRRYPGQYGKIAAFLMVRLPDVFALFLG